MQPNALDRGITTAIPIDVLAHRHLITSEEYMTNSNVIQSLKVTALGLSFLFLPLVTAAAVAFQAVR